MSEDHVAELVELLQLERLEDNLFRRSESTRLNSSH